MWCPPAGRHRRAPSMAHRGRPDNASRLTCPSLRGPITAVNIPLSDSAVTPVNAAAFAPPSRYVFARSIAWPLSYGAALRMQDPRSGLRSRWHRPRSGATDSSPHDRARAYPLRLGVQWACDRFGPRAGGELTVRAEAAHWRVAPQSALPSHLSAGPSPGRLLPRAAPPMTSSAGPAWTPAVLESDVERSGFPVALGVAPMLAVGVGPPSGHDLSWGSVKRAAVGGDEG